MTLPLDGIITDGPHPRGIFSQVSSVTMHASLPPQLAKSAPGDATPALRKFKEPGLNTDRYAEQWKLEIVLKSLFSEWERRYGVETIHEDYGQRFREIIKTAHEKTGRKVVILVDEYDKPLVGNLNKEDNFEHYRSRLASLYSNFKSSAEHIRLVFLTGVSRFSKLSVFSDLNNLTDITFSNEYADICGITEKELQKYFQEGIAKLAVKLGVCSALADRGPRGHPHRGSLLIQDPLY